MQKLISLNGDGNTVMFIRGNDGDICITFDCPSRKCYWVCVRVGVGNSGGQKVPPYVKDALIEVVNAMERWNKDTEKEIIAEKISEQKDKRKLMVKFLSLANQKRIINKMSAYDDSKSIHDNCVSFLKEIERQDRLEELAKQMEE